MNDPRVGVGTSQHLYMQHPRHLEVAAIDRTSGNFLQRTHLWRGLANGGNTGLGFANEW
jgi:hypothetical protein